ncbi:DsbA family protein [Patescibacteria group bacterium]|nr:DsbA family protein [Patescibacteria group bacterium]
MKESNSFLVPIAIIIAGSLIAWGLMSDKPKGEDINNENPVTQERELAPVTDEDHFIGDPNAELVIISYSDLECPYCKNFNATMERIMDEYGKDGKVALVFRHFPIDQLHSKARLEAIATECAAELGGNAKFWEYLNIVFERTPSNNGFDLAELPNIAEEIELDKEAFVACLDNEEMANRIKAQQETGINAGVQGTPQSFIVEKDGTQTNINGGQPYETVKLMIDTILNK